MINPPMFSPPKILWALIRQSFPPPKFCAIWYELCAAVNEWDDARKLLRLPTLFKGRAWVIFESLRDEEKDTYDHPKRAISERLNPDTDENHLVACEQLMLRRFKEGCESVDELARDLERMLDKSSPGLPAEIRETELRFHLMNSLPEKVAFRLKLSPKGTYAETISKAREISLIYSRADKHHPVSQIQPESTVLHQNHLSHGGIPTTDDRTTVCSKNLL